MRLTRTIAVISGSLVIAAGATFAVQAAGSDPVTLCANIKTGAVTVPPASGVCGKGTRSISLASDAALAALRQNDQEQAAAIAALQARIEKIDRAELTITNGGKLGNDYIWKITGSGLEPGAPVKLVMTNGIGVRYDQELNVPAPDGTLLFDAYGYVSDGACDERLVATTQSELGYEISTTSEPSIC